MNRVDPFPSEIGFEEIVLERTAFQRDRVEWTQFKPQRTSIKKFIVLKISFCYAASKARVTKL